MKRRMHGRMLASRRVAGLHYTPHKELPMQIVHFNVLRAAKRATLAVPLAVLTLIAAGLQNTATGLAATGGEDSHQILAIDHYVPHTSIAPATNGQPVTLYMRERAQADVVRQGSALTGKVVVFVQGSRLGSTGVFDAPYQDYSWMAYLAQSGFDTFGLDMTGYGLSTRPAPMDDPCNLDPAQQALLIPSVLPEPCPPSYPSQVTTLRSDWDDLDGAVDYVRALRHVDRVSLVGWSFGGSRAGGYAMLHPGKVDRLVLLAPAYDREHPNASAPESPAAGAPMGVTSADGLASSWDPQVQCSDQLDPRIRETIWNEGILADGVSWAPGLRRVPSFPNWNWNRSIAEKVQAPTLLISGEMDKVVPQQVVRDLYADLRTDQKLFVDLACSSHFAVWETRHLSMFQASLEWLQDGSVNHVRAGSIRLPD
jgi:pimeloyl-ACP methyl ester carboxylesterase